jgi:N-methylhydantoinase A
VRAYGDATTRVRDEASRTYVRGFSEISDREIGAMLDELAATAAQALDAEGVPRAEQAVQYQIDMRYKGQGMQLTADVTPEQFRSGGLRAVAARFDDTHAQLFTFALDAPHELVNLRSIVQGRETLVRPRSIGKSGADPSEAAVERTTLFVDGQDVQATIYDRARLQGGNRIAGPAIVVEMDATALVLPGHVGEVDAFGNILIRPNA